MHYIPQSTSEMLRGESTCAPTARTNFHYQSAPLYLLTLIVGGLLIADWIFSFRLSTSTPSSLEAGKLFGYRLALWAAVIGGSRILYHTLDGLLSGRFGADLALIVACWAAILLGEYQTAGLVVFIALVGESVEGYTIDRATWAVQQTFALWPAIAHRQHQGQVQDIPVEEVRIGDVVLVRPGERVPVDGQVVSGQSVVDQSPFTGESVPVDKQSGDNVLAGTSNQHGALTIVAESIGEQTALSRIAQLVSSAAARKGDLERVADRLAKWFLPAVVFAALATLVGWRIATGSWNSGYLPALGVLVVACPCPLILATPCAVMASLAWLARRGVVVKGSTALERLATVDTFAFDKTGTLTQGALALGEIFPTGSLTQNEILRIAAIAEQNSEHLLARIIVRAAEERGLPIPSAVEFRSITGAGVVAKVPALELIIDHQQRVSTDGSAASPQTALITVGNRRALDQGDIPFSDEIASLLRKREAAGESPLVVAIDGTVIGIIGIRETIRSESRHVLEELRRIGIRRFALLTGDRPQPADAVVQSLGFFEEIATEQLPADKANWVEAARRTGAKIAMVGDGVNDAPALATADVGLAVGGTGSELTAAAGDIILLGDPLRPLPDLIRLSRELVRNIWQSILLFAFGVNGLGVLLCTFRWLDPVGGAIFHEIASLAVMANAMRLLWFDGWSSSIRSRWLDRVLSALDWLAVNASPSEWVFWCLKRWQFGAKLLGPILLAAWLLSGVTYLTEDQQAVVTRFGRFKTTLAAGLHWCWPWPFESVTIARRHFVRSVQIGYRAQSGSEGQKASNATNLRSNLWARTGSWINSRNATASNVPRQSLVAPPIVEWTSTHDNRDQGDIADESLVLTADEVPVEVMAEVQYRVRDLRAFLFSGSQRPDEVIRASAESALREVAANASLDSLLTEQRMALERKALSRLRDRIEDYGLGIELLDLQWLDVHPPQAVVPAYRQVADAMEDRELLINEAEAYALRTLLATVGDQAFAALQSAAQRLPADGLNSAIRMDWQLKNDLWQKLVEQNPDGQMRLSGSAAAMILEGQTASVRREESARGIAQRFENLFKEFQRQPRLTNNYLYWSTLADVLSQKSLTIIDPKTAGRQQLWMGEQLPRGLFPPPNELRPKESTEPAAPASQR